VKLAEDSPDLPGQRATAVLHHEMRTRFGSVPGAIADPLFDQDGFLLSRDSFLFTTESGIRYHYALGQGIVAFLPGEQCDDEYRLYLWGTVFGAVAWLNGYFPLHASAVSVGGRAIAFTADSGVGKSTLAAALAARGYPHVCDDTLALVLTNGSPLAVPDRKPLKLWEDAFSLVGAERLGPITSMPGKSYAAAASRSHDALPLTDLIVLEEGDSIALTPIRGVAKLDSLAEAMYRDFIPRALGRKAAYHADLLALANAIGMWRLTRPRACGPSEFAVSTERIATLVASIGSTT
jgi:hypothetical protein